jgi:predicted nucleic acid-binding protein
MRTWVDASTLIALDAVGELDLLRNLVDRVTITKEIASEVYRGRESLALREGRGHWIEVAEVKGDRRRWQRLGLGRGEASLFLTPIGDRLVLDELPGRTVAEAEGRNYVGLLGLLLAGVQKGTISALRAQEVLLKLARSQFRMSTDLYDQTLRRLSGQV